MKAARALLAVAAAVSGAILTATPASADHAQACTDAYVAAITDEYYMYYADYPYSWWVRQNTVKYLECLDGE